MVKSEVRYDPWNISYVSETEFLLMTPEILLNIHMGTYVKPHHCDVAVVIYDKPLLGIHRTILG